ncbi:MAG: glyoxalase/bleomycin resistance protein/dioxygenase [Puniceicoccaceae bacterium 5H]|nr:MAG: glyoxalase/bleomycin resistance protein/dioxygenase [Puniceicoccaceae bacterium 5H]
MQFGRSTVLVRDYAEALAFYRDQLGLEVVYDGATPDGFRLLHLGFPGQTPAGLWLMQAQTEEQRALVGRQTGGFPCFVLYVSDCEAEFDRLQSLGVAFPVPPRRAEGATFAHCRDPFGNEIVLVQLPT